MEQQLQYLGKTFKIISAEQEFIVHPAAFELIPVTIDSLRRTFSCSFVVEDYRLVLDSLTLYSNDRNKSTYDNMDSKEIYHFDNLTASYNGAVLIAEGLTKEFMWEGYSIACFSYKNVLELIFEDGILITTIDQSRSMLRIRKNIELGYRSIANNRDVKLIKNFMNSSFVGDYSSFSSDKKRIKYLEEMKKDYQYITLSKPIQI